MNEDRIYKYGDNYYNIDELYTFFSKVSIEKKKEFKDCISHNILAEIFKMAGFDKESDIIMSLANIEYKFLAMSLGKAKKIINKRLYSLYMMKLFGFKSLTKESKLGEFMNGKWILGKLVSQTIGSSYDTKVKEDLEFIDYTSLTQDECKAIIRNYRRNINDKELEFYRQKTFRK